MKDLKDLSDDECYIKSLGKRDSSKNPGQSYYHYKLMRLKC